jgi:hypothetical protein
MIWRATNRKGTTKINRGSMTLLLAAAVFLSLPAYAADSAIGTTGHLAQMCGIETRPLGEPDPAGQGAYVTGMGVGYCRGMVIGVSTIASANAELSRDWPLKACPGNMNTKEIILRFRTWAAQNPAQWSEPAPIGLMLFLSESFPCR